MHKYFAKEDVLFHKSLGDVVVKDIFQESINLRTMNGQEYVFKTHDFGKVLSITQDSFTNGETGFEYLEKHKEEIQFVREERLEEVRKKKEKERERVFSEIEKYLDMAAFDMAKEVYQKNQGLVEQESYDSLCKTYQKIEEEKQQKKVLEEKERQRRRKIKEEEQRREKALQEEEDKKALEITNFFKDTFQEGKEDFSLDLEQASTMNHLDRHVLVAARAGSGKTRVIVAYILYLLEKEKLPKESLMVLAFNRNVPEEIKKRINEKVLLKKDPKKYQGLDMVRTFHKFAMDINKTDEKILANDRRSFIKNIIAYKISHDEDFAQRFYAFFRNRNNVTLQGEVVKSQGEKWIADFLFENNIDYYYEYSFYTSYIKKDHIEGTEVFKERCLNFIKESDNEVKPTFYLHKHKIVWEHLDDSSENMKWKRNFWKNWRQSRLLPGGHWAVQSIKNVKELIETSDKDSQTSREVFEEKLVALLKEQGIHSQQREKEDLLQEVSDKSLHRFANLVTSFIDRYQQNIFASKEEFTKTIETYQSKKRVYEFLNLSREVFDFYEELLKSTESDYSLDFNQLLRRAIDDINSGKADKEICKLEYLLIDEYQDFSELFFRLIQGIRERNPRVKIFCVGDDWQGINRFAGSDTKYFTEFTKYFPNGIRKEISRNYRSVEEIIKKSNQFMKKNGFPGIEAKATRSQDVPGVIKEVVTFIPISEEKQEDQDFMDAFTDPSGEKIRDFAMKTKYLKKCYEIIKENPGKGFLILHRYHYLRYDLSITAFREKLCNIALKNRILETEEMVSVSTMHSAKGMEEDVVILLEANESSLEAIHPDNELFEIFGDNQQTAIEDQKRLFYVAITRAKEKLYLLHEKDKESTYLKDF